MPALIRALLVLVAVAAPAFADGGNRVLLADADPELQRAVKATLAPWRLEVVVDADTPIDAAQLETHDARFVVWREHGELVVFDRERGATEHREAKAGPLDPASAAAAALTVKTLMRLPPPPPDERSNQVGPDLAVAPQTAPAEQITAPAPATDDGLGLRAQVGVASRMVRQAALGGRADVAVFVRPASVPLWIGIAGEFGPALDVQAAGFRGTWGDWNVALLGAYAFSISSRWEIEPHVGAGVIRSKLDGDESGISRHERATLALLRAGIALRARVGHFSFGASIDVDGNLGTPAYTRTTSGAQFFEVPPFALAVGLFTAIDLGR